MPNVRKPEELKLFKRPCLTNDEIPKLPKGYPDMPETLSPDAQLLWKPVCDLIFEIGILTKSCGFAVESLCETIVELRKTRATLRKLKTDTFKRKLREGGYTFSVRPEVLIRNDADRRLRMWLQVFGMTPADLSRVSVKTASKDEDDFDEFLN